jgi:hypothetical protein
MLSIKDAFKRISWRGMLGRVPWDLFVLCSLVFTSILSAESLPKKTFPSPVQASEALFRAAQADDTTALLEIFGTDGKEIVFSGDPAEDQTHREEFVQKYREMKRLVEEPDGTIRLYVGAENWPMPIPLVSKDDRWYFDTATGKQEIRLRQIGRDEITALRVLQELVDAEKEYYSEPRDKNVRQYAQKLRSGDRNHDGLFWKTHSGEPESPIGPHLADAGESSPATKPFNGYYFRILSRQGASAPNGAKNFIADGRMTGGFALLAYPAEYGVSGVMTFIAGQDGSVYQKDFGANTTALAKALHEYNPDNQWQKVE